MEEFAEFFLDSESANYLYSPDRTYTILESTHDSTFNIKNKKFHPDKYVFVSPYSSLQHIDSNVPMEVIEYPVDKKESNKFSTRELLGLSHDYKHIIIVGLFTPRKNQKYAFELAERLYQYPIKFHFLGNQAGNFESYWKPLMDNKATNKKLDNVVVWGERHDVSDFVSACDLFLFCSKTLSTVSY
jgi:glycosyltransferase involved in cell wall biosynthesis